MSIILDNAAIQRVPAGVPANRDRLFLASCVALIVTAMTFALRAGILGDLAAEFGLTDKQLGWVNSMAFYGFPVAMMIGGGIYNKVGPKTLLWIAFGSHLLGLVFTMTAGGFWGLIISTFLIGFANGSVEAACNPLIADMYPDKQGEMLNKFHVWFPGGIVIGSVLAFLLGDVVSWQVLIGSMLIPTAIYGVLMLGQKFPSSVNLSNDTAQNFSSLLTPLFIVMALLMTVTATTEFGATQWVERILGNAGANPMILLAMTAGIMAAGRYFAGPLIHSLDTTGVLFGSAILACIGLFMLSSVTGGMVYLATAVFALGICYFWPNMLAFTAEYLPKTGALGLSLIGGAGMLGAGIWNPIIGGWIDSGRSEGLIDGGIAAKYNIAALPDADGEKAHTLTEAYTAKYDAVNTQIAELEEQLATTDATGTALEAIQSKLLQAETIMADFNNAVELPTGQATLGNIALFPLGLIVAFAILYFFMRKRRSVPVDDAEVLSNPASAR